MPNNRYLEMMENHQHYPVDDVRILIDDLRDIQYEFSRDHGVEDIFSNSKFYEIVIANQMGHLPIPGHSGTRDAKNENGEEFEYKHFKETSSNHTWTFNDFSDNLISHMPEYNFVFAHINDKDYKYPGIMDWYYETDGKAISVFLKERTPFITNHRKMINVSPNNIAGLGFDKKFADIDVAVRYEGRFQSQLNRISDISEKIEELTGIDKVLTSNKLYELLVALELNHFVNPEQGGREGAHDAIDDVGNTYEYKVYKTRTWNFQDISDAVLEKYYLDHKIICALVDKEKLEVKEIYSASPKDIVPLLKNKLERKERAAAEKGKELRRKQVSITLNELSRLSSFERIM